MVDISTNKWRKFIKKNRGVYKTKIRIHVKIGTIREQLKTKL